MPGSCLLCTYLHMYIAILNFDRTDLIDFEKNILKKLPYHFLTGRCVTARTLASGDVTTRPRRWGQGRFNESHICNFGSDEHGFIGLTRDAHCPFCNGQLFRQPESRYEPEHCGNKNNNFAKKDV
jgi:hypothetical protein